MKPATSRFKISATLPFDVRHPGSWYKTSALSHLHLGPQKRADLASQPRDSLNVVVYEMSDDREDCRALIRAGQSGILYTRVFDG